MVRRSLQTPLSCALLAGLFAASCTFGRPPGAPPRVAPGSRASSAAAPMAANTDSPMVPAARQSLTLTDLVTNLQDDGSLLQGLSHSDPGVRRVAARGLARFPAPSNLKLMVARASVEADPAVLAELCFALGRWEDPEAGTPLRKLASHPASIVRAAALSALGRLRDDRETALLVQALSDSNALVRQAAALGLADLDGRRFKHPRKTSEAVLDSRDEALAEAIAEDPDSGVRWRATYAMASMHPRAAHVAPLLQAVGEADEDPVLLAFALRGLGSLDKAGLTDGTIAARQLLQHNDQRVVFEAVSVIGAHGQYRELGVLALSHENPGVRSLAWSHLAASRARERALRASEFGAPQWPLDLAQLDSSLQDQLAAETELSVRREALAALASIDTALDKELGPEWREGIPESSTVPKIERRRVELAAAAVRQLAQSPDPRDRARAGELIVSGIAQDGDLIIALLDDADPRVEAAMLPLLGDELFESLRSRLGEALTSGDPALMGQAAVAAAPVVAAGMAEPWLVSGLADALENAQDFILEETRIELATALGLPALDPLPLPVISEVPLLQHLLQQELEAANDPAPTVTVETDRGTVTLRLDRVLAPVHVASFLELAASGFYDGLDFHRVVPNFVVQGLDPRGDGWGVGGRRVPDEQSPRPFVSGSLGMPAAGQPQTGGCQIFITQLPTPHLNGNYTLFGQVIDGMDVVQSLLVGDKVLSVRRIEG
ncbi:MAG: cyclophilin family peptidyl-prolyl cis-trans isomerase/HEAT repeat protein [Pseudohongiellaceae bacterium]|jgi:cyclophilin family peptidyl-prolyl cis-trans isomerase/HEAT repeat protein